ncbi:MAG: phosphoribosyltransferase [Planctomycetota bacterium]|jgi:hypoxanthine phosphoribosyltransferase
MQFPTLIARDVLSRRIAELAVEVGTAFPDEPPCLVAVLEGARTFADQLCRRLPGKPEYHGIRARSYGAGTVSAGNVEICGTEKLPVAGRVVLLIEDIVDTGLTAQTLYAHLMDLGAREVWIVTLLNKPTRRVTDVDLRWVGFEIPDEFVIGFGLDINGRYRDLDHIAVYREAMVEET